MVKPLIFRLFRTLPVSQRLRFLCLIIMACETSGIKLQGPSLCIRTHGWKFLSKKVDRLLTKNPLSETNVEFGFFVSSFLGQLFCFRISPDPYADCRMDASGNPFLAGMGRYHLFLFPDVFQKYLQTSRRESEISADDTRHPDIFLQAA